MKSRILGLAGLAASVTLLAAWSVPAPATRQNITYNADMNAAKATPPSTEKGTGRATFKLDGHMIHYTITVDGLSGPATAAHIHVGAIGKSGPPVYAFTIKKIAKGTLAEGTIDLTKNASKTVSGDSLKVLLNNGNAYVNVHTAAHPSGEIRGQISQ
jgi:Cu/Zn superoxide dismutase